MRNEKNMGQGFTLVVHSDRTRGNGHTLRYRKSHVKSRSLFNGDYGYGWAQLVQRIPAVCLSLEIFRNKWTHF